MSRCFPYPPPGYEPRPRTEHKDLLKKERHQGKKHRKENGREKRERKGRERRKGKDKDHKKHKREKRREKRKNKDRDKDKHKSLEQETQETGNFDNRRPKERRKYEAKCLEGLVAQFPDQRGHTNHKVRSITELIPAPGRSKGFGSTAYNEKESSLGRPVKKSGHEAQQYHGMIQKNGINAYANKKQADAGVSSQTRIKNSKNLQVGSGERHSNRRHKSKVKQMKRSGDINEHNKVDDLMHLTSLDKQKFACDDIKKRKELDTNSTLHENATKTNKLPRMSPTNITCVNGETSHHSRGIAPYSSLELGGTNNQEADWNKPQDDYSNGFTGSCNLEKQKVSVPWSVYDSNKGYLESPHPDTKYMGQLLSIPPREEPSEYIDQDWLLSKDRVERNTATFEAAGAGSHQVWSDAQLIYTADVVALPYVVPL